MADRGIIFSAPMVRALLDGRKTQTRRLCKMDNEGDFVPPIHRRNDRLYVRETCAIVGSIDPGWVLYRASGYEAECQRHGFDDPPPEPEVRWRPSIHMPRWASRLTLIVSDVRVQRLQAISEEDARTEGLSRWDIGGEGTRWNWHDSPSVVWPQARAAFEALWNSLHDKPGTTWADNPWIYAVTFDVVQQNIDQMSHHGLPA